MVELVVPSIGESITEVTIAEWLKAVGEWAEKDNPVVVLESEKATVELPAPASGTLARIDKKAGESAKIGEVIGALEESNRPPAVRKSVGEVSKPSAPPPPPMRQEEPPRIMPAARRVMAEKGLAVNQVKGTGPGRRILKEDALRPAPPAKAPVPPKGPTVPSSRRADGQGGERFPGGREEESVAMSPLRKTIAARLVAAQHTAAMLTTFNEIDMSAVKQLRAEHQESFQEKHGIKLGIMSFFVKSTIEALKTTPQLNAEIRDDHIVYRNYFDIGIAVGGGKGLVVPVLRNAERLSFAEIETQIADFARRAQENRLKLEELQAGTFTISNGGVYGSLLSTPIINPPQSGILGLHAIQDRPVARGGQIVIRPMMYVAVTYDHRIIDGREAVLFLRHIKELMEEPSRILLEV